MKVQAMRLSEFLGSLFTDGGWNASYHLLVIAYMQVLYTGPRSVVTKLGWEDNANPRDAIPYIEKSGKVAPKLVEQVKRRAAAHQNNWEMLPMCAAAVLAGNLADLGNVYMNRFMIAYIILRGVYVRQYVINETQKGSMVRSAFWGLSALSVILTLLKAGNKLNANNGLEM